MTTLHVAAGEGRIVTNAGGSAIVYAGKPLNAESITTSGTSAQSSALASSGQKGRLFARCFAVDSAHYVVAGPDETASATNGYYVDSGGFIDLEIGPGDKIAAITA